MGFVDVGILLLTYSGSYLCYENLYYTKISFQYCMPFKIYKKKKRKRNIGKATVSDTKYQFSHSRARHQHLSL